MKKSKSRGMQQKHNTDETMGISIVLDSWTSSSSREADQSQGASCSSAATGAMSREEGGKEHGMAECLPTSQEICHIALLRHPPRLPVPPEHFVERCMQPQLRRSLGCKDQRCTHGFGNCSRASDLHS